MRWFMKVGRDVLLFAYGCLHYPWDQFSGMGEMGRNSPDADAITQQNLDVHYCVAAYTCT